MILSFVPIVSMAGEVTLIDGIYYLIEADNTAEVINKYGEYNRENGANTYSGDVSIPSTIVYQDTEYPVKRIGECAFYKCTNLNSVSIPNSITTIERYSFQDCTNLSSVIIPESVTKIDEKAFKGCSSIQTVVIPDNVKTIGTETFAECISLESVTIGTATTSIGSQAFKGCSSLTTLNYNATNATIVSTYNSNVAFPTTITSINIGDKVESIPDYFVKDCKGLTSLTIPNSVKTIGYYSFSGCSGITNLTLGNSVESIRTKAFSWCSSLRQINSLNVAPPSCFDDTFSQVDKNQTIIYVPKGSKEFYTKDKVWVNFLCFIEDTESEEVKTLKARIKALESGDYNGDGSVSIEDVTILVHKILQIEESE